MHPEQVNACFGFFCRLWLVGLALAPSELTAGFLSLSREGAHGILIL